MDLKQLSCKLQQLFGRKLPETALPTDDNEPVCCDPNSTVHIAFRGLSDDRMYLAYNRKYPELRYFRGNGLRAFCVKCRRRVF